MGRRQILLIAFGLLAGLGIGQRAEGQTGSLSGLGAAWGEPGGPRRPPSKGSRVRWNPAEMTRASGDTLFLTLDEAVARGLRDSEEMAAARTILLQADAQVTQAKSGALPQVSSNFIYNRAIKTIFDEANVPPPVSDTLIPPAFDPDKPPEERYDLLRDLLMQDFMGALFRGLPFGRKNTYLATFTLAQPLYVGGKVGAALSVARHFKAAAQNQMDEAEAEFVLQVRGAYLTAALARRLHRIAVESRRVAEEHFR